MGPTIAKKGNFNKLYNWLLDPQLPEKENLMGPTATKNEKFNELYNCFKNHFRIIFPFLIIVGSIW